MSSYSEIIRTQCSKMIYESSSHDHQLSQSVIPNSVSTPSLLCQSRSNKQPNNNNKSLLNHSMLRTNSSLSLDNDSSKQRQQQSMVTSNTKKSKLGLNQTLSSKSSSNHNNKTCLSFGSVSSLPSSSHSLNDDDVIDRSKRSHDSKKASKKFEKKSLKQSKNNSCIVSSLHSQLFTHSDLNSLLTSAWCVANNNAIVTDLFTDDVIGGHRFTSNDMLTHSQNFVNELSDNINTSLDTISSTNDSSIEREFWWRHRLHRRLEEEEEEDTSHDNTVDDTCSEVIDNNAYCEYDWRHANNCDEHADDTYALPKADHSGVSEEEDDRRLEIVNELTSTYYRKHFFGFEHQNWLSQQVGLSVRKRQRTGGGVGGVTPSPLHSWRVVLRTVWSLRSIRGTLYSSSPSLTRDVVQSLLTLVCPPEVDARAAVTPLRLALPSADDALVAFDEKLFACNQFKIGIMYMARDRNTEDQMYATRVTSTAFDAFVALMGTRVRLKGFDGFRGGLDTRADTSGQFSLYTRFGARRRLEVMFHVSPWLPFADNKTDKQQICRKRHIGNDITTIVFQDADTRHPFDPTCIRSHFQHVFIVVKPYRHGYRVSVARHHHIPHFGPKLKSFYSKHEIREAILTKAINGERAAHTHVPAFRTMQTRSRDHALRDCFDKYASSQCLSDSASATNDQLSSSSSSHSSFHSNRRFLNEKLFNKFRRVSSLGFNSKTSSSCGAIHNNACNTRTCTSLPPLSLSFLTEYGSCVNEALVLHSFWFEVTLSLSGRRTPSSTLSLIAISKHFLIAFNRLSVQWVVTCPSVIGWQQIDEKTLRIYYHRSEWIQLKLIETTTSDDYHSSALNAFALLKTRLENVTRGSQTIDLIIRRNASLVTSHARRTCALGFRMSEKACEEGVVTDVDLFGHAYNSGLRVGARVLEICKISLNQLKTNEEINELLQTSLTVSLTLIPHVHSARHKRIGCHRNDCERIKQLKQQITENNDYENVSQKTLSSPLPSIVTPSSLTPSQHVSNHYSKALLNYGVRTRATPSLHARSHNNHHHSNHTNNNSLIQNLSNYWYSTQSSASGGRTGGAVTGVGGGGGCGGSSATSTTSSTTSSAKLREDLIKLITNDDENDDEDDNNNNGSRISSSSSDENDEVIITTAHPAKVIQSTLSTNNNITSHRSSSSSSALDWPSLVLTANNFLFKNEDNNDDEDDDDDTRRTTITVKSGSSSASLEELEGEVAKLKNDKMCLEDTIASLKAENQRLHTEAETSSQQLRKFCAWFYDSNGQQ